MLKMQSYSRESKNVIIVKLGVIRVDTNIPVAFSSYKYLAGIYRNPESNFLTMTVL